MFAIYTLHLNTPYAFKDEQLTYFCYFGRINVIYHFHWWFWFSFLFLDALLFCWRMLRLFIHFGHSVCLGVLFVFCVVLFSFLSLVLHFVNLGLRSIYIFFYFSMVFNIFFFFLDKINVSMVVIKIFFPSLFLFQYFFPKFLPIWPFLFLLLFVCVLLSHWFPFGL